MSAATVKTKLRSDPVDRPVDGLRGRGKLIGKDPALKYVFASRSDSQTGEAYYEALGFKIVRNPMGDEPGVRLWGGKTSKPGEPIEQMGHVLMSLPLTEYEQIFREGDGDSLGQNGIDQIERRIIDKSNHTVDRLRGLTNEYIQITENKTTAEQAMIG